VRIEFNDCELQLYPENEADEAEIVRLFGNSRPDGEFDRPAWGRAIRREGDHVVVGVANAPWNYDD
jgi:hypothetical protein